MRPNCGTLHGRWPHNFREKTMIGMRPAVGIIGLLRINLELALAFGRVGAPGERGCGEFPCQVSDAVLIDGKIIRALFTRL